MHVVTIRRRHGEREYASTLVRRSIREGKRVRKETIANLSRLPAEAVEAVLLGAMDWLLPQQERIEAALARRYLKPGGLVLSDLSASYLVGRTCPLAALGYPRDGKRGKLQIQYGLTCSPEGRPVAVDVFDGNIHDDKTFPSALERLKRRFGIERVVVCGDRGMV